MPELNAKARTLTTARGVWQIAGEHATADGVDVVLSYRPLPDGPRLYSAYRWAAGSWVRLNAAWRHLPRADKVAEVAGSSPLGNRDLIRLLALTLTPAERQAS